MTLIGYIRALGIRRGLRWWWVALRGREIHRGADFQVHHGTRPSMPGYRRRRSR